MAGTLQQGSLVPLSGSSARRNGVWVPSDNGLLAGDNPNTMANVFAPAAGIGYLRKIQVPERITVASIVYGVGTAGAGTAAVNVFGALFDSTGTRRGTTTDQAAGVTSTGVKTATLTVDGGQSLTVGGNSTTDFVYAYFLVGTQNGTTQFALVRNGPGVVAITNAGTSAGTFVAATIGSALSAVPASLTLSGSASNQAPSLWLA